MASLPLLPPPRASCSFFSKPGMLRRRARALDIVGGDDMQYAHLQATIICREYDIDEDKEWEFWAELTRMVRLSARELKERTGWRGNAGASRDRVIRDYMDREARRYQGPSDVGKSPSPATSSEPSPPAALTASEDDEEALPPAIFRSLSPTAAPAASRDNEEAPLPAISRDPSPPAALTASEDDEEALPPAIFRSPSPTAAPAASRDNEEALSPAVSSKPSPPAALTASEDNKEALSPTVSSKPSSAAASTTYEDERARLPAVRNELSPSTALMASEGTKGAPLSAIVGELSSTAAPTMSGDDQDATALSAGTPAGRRRGRRLPWLNDQIPEEKANMVLDQQKSALAKGPSQQKKRANDHFQDTIYMTPLKYRKCSDLSREVMQDSNHERTDDDVIFLEERFSKMTGREISPPEVRGKESGGDEVGSLWPASCQLFGYTAQCKGMSPEQRERFRLDAEARSAAVVWVMAEETAIASSDVEL